MDCINGADQRFTAAKRALFSRLYSFLNDRQKEAVFTVKGPLLVLAGAGSGKTTVLVNRIAHIVKYGDAYMDERLPAGVDEDEIAALERAVEDDKLSKEDIEAILSRYAVNPCPPWAILSITFTNKAASEMKARLATAVPTTESCSPDDIWAGTFHYVCLRILRKFCDRLGYKNGFTIFDTDDTKRTVSACMKALNIDEKNTPPKQIAMQISRAKEKLLSPADLAAKAEGSFKDTQVAQIYAEYQKRLKESNVVDFDDIIMLTVKLLRDDAEALEYVRKRFKYVCVDEYQDTNYAQFELTTLLSGGTGNLMVVGDDDQSIYRFRGATIENILSFDEKIPNARVIKLEQNYRSTGNILGAANALISHNNGRHAKELWTDSGEGEKLILKKVDTQNEEAKYIVNKIMELVIREKRKMSDFAVLYRVNAQSNTLESIFNKSGIAYRMLGGTRFYERKEIRDIIAYLCVINNRADNIRLKRIINEPKRKIGESTVSAVEALAARNGCSMFDIMARAEEFPALAKSATKLRDFTMLINGLDELSQTAKLSDLFRHTIVRSGYRQMLLEGGDSELDRLLNIEELISNAVAFEESHPEPTLAAFLEETALINDVDNYDENADAVVLMTIHSAKGLEFPVVFLPGMEEGIFPGMQASMNPEELEEERRLAYVALTRAKSRVFIVHARERLLYGRTQYNHLSRFVDEIPAQFIERPEIKLAKQEEAQKQQRKKPVISKEFFKKSDIAAPVGRSSGIERFAPGDSVEHMTFGHGTILSAKEMGADMIYEIAFDDHGTKKLMATYAKLKRSADAQD